ncbi:MAG: nicotinamide-nucleotide amidohydrolase family protein [Lachnospiraceae bacterium]|nr:nicotinamide-nucleotide amidohydrolase family protein [Lachnospiraceae bacterium]
MEDKEVSGKEDGGKQPEKPESEQDHYEQVLRLCGIGMNDVKNSLADLRDSSNPKLTLDSERGEIYIKVAAVNEGEKSAKKIAKPVIKEIKGRFSEKIYGIDDGPSLSETVFELLKGNSLTLATAESCTGGLIASRIVDLPGASEVFKEGFITYSNKAKRARLGVKKSTLNKYGAVSGETVKEMARGGAFFSKADVCVSVSGIAGPDGGTAEKPVGTVFVGCCIKGKTVISECHFKGDRNDIREQAVTEALALIRRCVLKYYSEKNFLGA